MGCRRSCWRSRATYRGCWRGEGRVRSPMRGASCCKRCRGVAEEVITLSADETISWGRDFAKRLHAPVMVLLSGDLGSGKTTVTKGIVAGLNAAKEDEVTSPTYTLVHEYG